jgi:hypothetical protein
MRNEYISQEELTFYTGDSPKTFSRIKGKLNKEKSNLVDTSQKVHKIHHSILDDKMSKHHKVLEIFSNALIQKTNKTNEVWARYLINFDWKIFGTITFDKPKSLHSAKRFMDDIINKVRKRNKLYTCFYVCELNDNGYHVHFLMNCKLDRLKPIMALIEISINKSNKSEIEKYDYKKLGSKYLTKFLDKNPDSYEIYFD